MSAGRASSAAASRSRRGSAPDGRVAWSEGEENIREAIRIVLMTEPGERLRRPEFGAGLDRSCSSPTRRRPAGTIEERIRRALAAWEPRIAVEAVDVDADPSDAAAAASRRSTFRLVATQTVERVTAADRGWTG